MNASDVQALETGCKVEAESENRMKAEQEKSGSETREVKWKRVGREPIVECWQNWNVWLMKLWIVIILRRMSWFALFEICIVWDSKIVNNVQMFIGHLWSSLNIWNMCQHLNIWNNQVLILFVREQFAESHQLRSQRPMNEIKFIWVYPEQCI